jgi:hypothetical protein
LSSGYLWRLIAISFEKKEIEFYAETSAAFCAVTIHLVVEAWLHTWKRWVRKSV